MNLLRVALIQPAWCSQEKRKCGYTDIVSTHRKDHVKTQEDGHLQAKERETSEEIKLANTLILDFQHPQAWQNKFHLFKPPSLKHRHTSFYCILQCIFYVLKVCGNCILARLSAPFFQQHLLTSYIYYVTFW